jgi:hypothetical protein
MSKTTEPKVIQVMRRIVANHQFERVACPVTKKKSIVDATTANAICFVYDNISDASKAKYAAESLPRMASIAYTLKASR